MSDKIRPIVEQALKPVEPMPCPCELKIVDGHIEADCLTKEEQVILRDLLEKEVVIRVKPKVAIE